MLTYFPLLGLMVIFLTACDVKSIPASGSNPKTISTTSNSGLSEDAMLDAAALRSQEEMIKTFKEESNKPRRPGENQKNTIEALPPTDVPDSKVNPNISRTTKLHRFQPV